MGADCIYTESLALDAYGGGVGSLIYMTPVTYTVKELGESAKWFIHQYVPAHPRRYNCHQVKPRVAIVRQPDGCWGQKYSWAGLLPDWLFGNSNWNTTDNTEAWIKIWHLLTRGTVTTKSLNWWTTDMQSRAYRIFCPVDGVIVFDHHVGFEHLDGVEVIFLTGVGVSPETSSAIEQCVTNGAKCVSLPHLVPNGLPDPDPNGIIVQGSGRWVVTNDFLSDTVRGEVAHVIPQEDIIRYRFGDNTVIMKEVRGIPDCLVVRVLTED
jgi:hypothetical protein